MDTQLVNFTIPKVTLMRVDKLAKKEERSRSELFRNAIKRYLLAQKVQKDDFLKIKKAGSSLNLTEDKAMELVENMRNSLLLNQ